MNRDKLTHPLFRAHYSGTGKRIGLEITWTDDKPLVAISNEVLDSLDESFAHFDGQVLSLGPWKLTLEALDVPFPNAKVFRRTDFETNIWSLGEM